MMMHAILVLIKSGNNEDCVEDCLRSSIFTHQFSPWLFGYIAGLGTGVVLMLLLCGCVLCIGRNKRSICVIS